MSSTVHSTEMKETDIRSTSSSRRHVQEGPHAYKVGVPAKQKWFTEFKGTVKETFFADEPLRPFKDQSNSRKCILGVQTLFPILEWIWSYNLKKFRGDLIAGLTIASLCIPQDIGYAKLANLAPQYGLYSSFVPPLIYAAMGSSRDIAIGPVAVVSLLLGTLLQAELDPKDPDYRRLAFTATFFAGVTQLCLGFFRLGFLIDFLSHAAIVGFMGGAAITISLQQLKGFLGIKVFTKKTDIISVLNSVFSAAHHGWNWQTIVIGASFLSFLLFTKFIGKRNKKFFWVPAIAPMISVILSTFFVYITRADKDGVAIVKHIDKGINPPSLKLIFFTGDYLAKGFKIGVVAGLIALTEAVAIGRTFASMKDYQLDGNKEMVALGTMNIVGSMTSCYVATGSFSRSAVNYMAGCQTAVSNIVMSLVVLLTLKFITPLFKYTPNAILAAIIISAVIGLIDIEAALVIWKTDKFDFVACMGAFFGVVFISVEIGLLVVAWTDQFSRCVMEGINILWENPSTSNKAEDSGSWEDTQHIRLQKLSTISFCFVFAVAVTDIDTSGIHAFEDLHKALERKEVQLILANPGPVVMEKLHASGLITHIGEDKIFLTVADAVASCSPKMAEQAA